LCHLAPDREIFKLEILRKKTDMERKSTFISSQLEEQPVQKNIDDDNGEHSGCCSWPSINATINLTAGLGLK
jgi:hypothetical protein